MLARSLRAALMLEAFRQLDRKLDQPAHLVIGGGAALALAYGLRLVTQDVDAFAARGGLRIADLDTAAKQVAAELHLMPDWLNSHFETFTAVLPQDYAQRLKRVFGGKRLLVDALGAEDLLIMKAFAGRDKDLPHARALLRHVVDVELVDGHLSSLVQRRYPGAQAAADFFDDLRDAESA